MRAIGYRKASPELDHLEAFDIPRPKPEDRDLLVEVRAVSVNPVDYKVASGGGPGAPADTGAIKVVGYDAAGVVVETGREARLFKPGDEVSTPAASAARVQIWSFIWSTSGSLGASRACSISLRLRLCP
jgi:NADPH:quinone reductase-like Zn-dependent oxidoreductase